LSYHFNCTCPHHNQVHLILLYHLSVQKKPMSQWWVVKLSLDVYLQQQATRATR